MRRVGVPGQRQVEDRDRRGDDDGERREDAASSAAAGSWPTPRPARAAAARTDFRARRSATAGRRAAADRSRAGSSRRSPRAGRAVPKRRISAEIDHDRQARSATGTRPAAADSRGPRRRTARPPSGRSPPASAGRPASQGAAAASCRAASGAISVLRAHRFCVSFAAESALHGNRLRRFQEQKSDGAFA